MANEASAKKKRRVRPSSQTVREQAQQAKSELKQESVKKPSRSAGKMLAPLAPVFKPLGWLGRHLIPRYLRKSFAELGNVTWIGRKQSRQLTTAVILFAIVFGALVSVLDLGLDKVFKKVFLKE